MSIEDFWQDAADKDNPPAKAVGDAARMTEFGLLAVSEARAGVATDVATSGSATRDALDALFAPVRTHTSPLAKWFAALAKRSATPAQVIVFGDSIAEGTGATTVAGRWQTLLQGSLRSRYGVTSGALWPFIPAMGITSHPAIVRTGTMTQQTGIGFGGRAATLGVDGQLAFTFTGTRAKILYLKASATGVMRIVLDGGAPIIVDTNAISNPPSGAPAVWDSGALASGAHTLVITRDASSATGQGPWVEGILTYNGDEAAGIRVIDSSRHGTNSTYLDATRSTAQAKSLAAAGGAGLAIIAYGTNDYAVPVSAADLRTNVERQITALRAQGFAGSVLLVLVYMGMDRVAATWDAYGAALAASAAADPDVDYLDLRRAMPDIPNPYTAASGLGLFYDTLHPSDAGHGWIADVLANYLTIRV